MNARLAYLYQRYIEDTFTAEEREEFLSMVDQHPENEHITGLMDGTWDKIETDKLLFPGADAVLEHILSDHQKTIAKKISWYRYAAVAAAVLIMVASGIYFFQHNNSQSDIQTDIADIQAGKNRATLTLANGTIINLDSVSDGEIAAQSGISITKTAEGQLVYSIVKPEEKENNLSEKIAYNTITTPRGGQYQVNLPDGSKIWLNAASSLKYPTVFEKDKRKVELTGEAYFEIAKVMIKNQERKPFIVVTGKQEVEVLGTHFNINSYLDEAATKTTLLEGAVRVLQFGTGKTANLLPGQQSVLNNNNLTTRIVDTEEIVAWKEGYFQFNESDLGSIMRQLSRWYNVDIVFDGRSPDDLFHFKVTRNLSLTEVLKIFENNGINLKIEGRKLIVKS
jgi:transmembrane sensor